MELDESVEREKLVSEGEDDDPSPLETVAHVPAKPPVIPTTQSVILPTKKSVFPGALKLYNRSTRNDNCYNRNCYNPRPNPYFIILGPALSSASSTVYREPTVVIVNNAVQRSSTVASPSTATASSLTNSIQAPMSPKSSANGGGGGGGPGSSSGARLMFVNERSGSTHSSTNGGGKTNSTLSTDKTVIKPRKIQRGNCYNRN